MILAVGDIVETPFGPGVIIEVIDKVVPQSLTVSVSGTDYRVKQIGWIAIGHIDVRA